MKPEDFITAYNARQNHLPKLMIQLKSVQNCIDALLAEQAELATLYSKDLTPLRDGQMIIINGRNFCVMGDIMADVEDGKIVITLFALDVAADEPTTLHLDPQPGTQWSYPTKLSNDKEAA